MSKKELYWTDSEYVSAIQTIKSACSEDIIGENSDTIGNKYNECSIGLCSSAFEDRKVFPPYRANNHLCPLDMRQDLTRSSGCFYDCVYFKPTRNKTGLTPKELVINFKIKF